VLGRDHWTGPVSVAEGRSEICQMRGVGRQQAPTPKPERGGRGVRTAVGNTSSGVLRLLNGRKTLLLERTNPPLIKGNGNLSFSFTGRWTKL